MFSKVGLKFVSTGIALPEGHLTHIDAHRKAVNALGDHVDLERFDIKHRYVNTGETVSDLATRAIQSALKNANLKPTDLDLIIMGNSMPEQPIPTTSILIHKKLGLEETGIPCFDVNSTCTSFLTALEIAMGFLQTGRYKRIAIVSADIGSKGINWKEVETAGLFGDGGAAAIVEIDPTKSSNISAFLTKSYSAGADCCEIKAGGSRYNVVTPPPDQDDFLFTMKGRVVYKMASKLLPPFLDELFAQADLKISDIDWFVPHQASPLGMKHIIKGLGFPEEKTINIIQTHGNQVSASLPTTLHYCLQEKAKKNDRILMIGTGAGLNIYGTIFTY